MSEAAAMAESHAHVACPACLKANRIPVARLGDGPKCGGCGTPLLDGKTVALDERSFDAFVGRTDLPVVVDFWAPWCAPCRAMAPAFESAAAELATRVRFAKLNTEEAQGLAARFGIRSIPTLAVFRNGQEVERISGAMDARSLVRWVSERI